MTGTAEPISPELLAQEYTTALRAYVSGGSEAALTRAYELGRKAASGGLGILDLAMVHHEALAGLQPRGAGDRPAVGMAAQFLAESLSPFEMTLRSYRANARLLGLGETLAQQNAEIDRSREQLRTILDATTAVIYMKDAEGRYLFVNRQFQETFGRRRDEVIGKVDGEILSVATARTLHADDVQVLSARAPRELEEIIETSDGPHTYLSLKFPLLDDRGAPYGLCCVATDITERKRAEEALQRAREAAERERQMTLIVESRDQFLAISSHELKTPLTSLELQVDGLRRIARSNPKAAVSDERVQSKCDIIVRQVERLTVLINNLIDVGKITSGRLVPAPERVELGEVVRVVLARTKEAIEHSGSHVALHVAGPVVGTWDRRLVETVVGHLVSNAVKFGDGKPIEIAVGATADRATLVVRDHGIGISVEDQERIFERFERAVSARHFGGFGIGLWVARQAVEAHGGAIRVQSAHGHGSEFTIDLPLGHAEPKSSSEGGVEPAPHVS
ncbi:MAG TPA: ATP-binding protein [Anaeromyxobacteraceae bacterium]